MFLYDLLDVYKPGKIKLVPNLPLLCMYIDNYFNYSLCTDEELNGSGQRITIKQEKIVI